MLSSKYQHDQIYLLERSQWPQEKLGWKMSQEASHMVFIHMVLAQHGWFCGAGLASQLTRKMVEDLPH
jgi:hypothetical protein